MAIQGRDAVRERAVSELAIFLVAAAAIVLLVMAWLIPEIGRASCRERV